MRLAAQRQHDDQIDELLHPDFHTHSPRASDGRRAFIDYMMQHLGKLKHAAEANNANRSSLTLAMGKYVLWMWDRTSIDPTTPDRQYHWNGFDLFKIEQNAIKEHWDETTLGPE